MGSIAGEIKRLNGQGILNRWLTHFPVNSGRLARLCHGASPELRTRARALEFSAQHPVACLYHSAALGIEKLRADFEGHLVPNMNYMFARAGVQLQSPSSLPKEISGRLRIIKEQLMQLETHAKAIEASFLEIVGPDPNLRQHLGIVPDSAFIMGAEFLSELSSQSHSAIPTDIGQSALINGASACLGGLILRNNSIKKISGEVDMLTPSRILAQQLKAVGEGSVTVFPIHVSSGILIWVGFQYGPEPTTGGDDYRNLFRGYVQVEPYQLPRVITILKEIAKERLVSGKPTCFKFLASKQAKILRDPKPLGNYENLGSDEPVLAIYGDDFETVQEVLISLADRPEWDGIENERTQAEQGRGKLIARRREGTSAFSHKGREYRTLNFNFKRGTAERFLKIYGPDWRSNVIGSPTISL